MSKPIIGIVGKPYSGNEVWHFMEIVDDIRYMIIRNGGLALGVLPTDNKLDFKDDEEVDYSYLNIDEIKDLEEVIDKLDGIILEGGLVSNQYEEEIAKICINKDIPVLGICSGFNVLVRALGGKVNSYPSTFHNQFGSIFSHVIDINQDSKLYSILNVNKTIVNSIHTYIAKEDDIKEFKVVAKCPVDNTVEAIELENKRFVMGVKWHPELMDCMNEIFLEFVKECNKNNIN